MSARHRKRTSRPPVSRTTAATARAWAQVWREAEASGDLSAAKRRMVKVARGFFPGRSRGAAARMATILLQAIEAIGTSPDPARTLAQITKAGWALVRRGG